MGYFAERWNPCLTPRLRKYRKLQIEKKGRAHITALFRKESAWCFLTALFNIVPISLDECVSLSIRNMKILWKRAQCMSGEVPRNKKNIFPKIFNFKINLFEKSCTQNDLKYSSGNMFQESIFRICMPYHEDWELHSNPGMKKASYNTHLNSKIYRWMLMLRDGKYSGIF